MLVSFRMLRVAKIFESAHTLAHTLWASTQAFVERERRQTSLSTNLQISWVRVSIANANRRNFSLCDAAVRQQQGCLPAKEMQQGCLPAKEMRRGHAKKMRLLIVIVIVIVIVLVAVEVASQHQRDLQTVARW